MGRDWDNVTGQAPHSQPFGQGYDPNHGAVVSPHWASARLSDAGPPSGSGALGDGQFVWLFCYDVSTNLALAGSTAQSRLKRSFFAKNFSQTEYVLKCQAPSQKEYGRVVEFIHAQQHNSVKTGNLTKLDVFGGGFRNPRGNITSGNMRGYHSGLSAVGYVKNIPRRHSFGEYAVDFQFSFVISQSLAGPFKEQVATTRRLRSWTEIISGLQAQGAFNTYTVDPAPAASKPSDPPPRSIDIAVH